MVHNLFLTDSRNFNPVQNIPYTVLLHCDTDVSAANIFLFYLNFIIIILCAGEFLQKCFLPFIYNLKISLHTIHWVHLCLAMNSISNSITYTIN